MPGALQYARDDVTPGGLGRNRDFLLGQYVTIAPELDEAAVQRLFDPQTSGGLLLALPLEDAVLFEQACAAAGELCYRIGHVEPGSGITVV